MAYEIHFSRRSDDLSTTLPITEAAWINCVETVEGIRLGPDFPYNVEAYSEAEEDWIEIFWLGDDGNGSMKAPAFFSEPVYYEKAIEMAAHLNAYIYGDEGEIYYLPGYGIIYDDVEVDNPGLTFEQLAESLQEYGKDYEKIIAVNNPDWVERQKRFQ
ncbi:MAG: hypothetical protein WCR52_17430 [Bacteroidota bacterium]